MISPDGSAVVVVAPDGQVQGWSTSTWQRLPAFGALEDGIPSGSRFLSSPELSPDGKILTAIDVNGNTGGNRLIALWDMSTGQSRVLPLGYFSSISPGPQGEIAGPYSEGSGYKVGLADLASGQVTGVLSVNGGADGAPYISSALLSPDGGTVAASGSSGAVYLWNVATKRQTGTLPLERLYNTTSDNVGSIAFAPDSQRVACGSDSGVLGVWDVATGHRIATFTVNGSAPSGAAARPVRTLVFSPGGKNLVTADGADGSLSVWDVTSGRKVAALTANSGKVASVAFATSGALLVATTSSTASGQRIDIWTTGNSLAANLHGS